MTTIGEAKRALDELSLLTVNVLPESIAPREVLRKFIIEAEKHFPKTPALLQPKKEP